MRNLGIVFILVFAVLVIPVFGQGHPPKPPELKGSPTFVEEPIPEGKALIYVYSRPEHEHYYSGGLLILSISGPIGVLIHGSYLSYVVDPGKVMLFFTYLSSKELIVDAVAGQSYYLRTSGELMPFVGVGVSTDLLTPEKAKTDDENLELPRFR